MTERSLINLNHINLSTSKLGQKPNTIRDSQDILQTGMHSLLRHTYPGQITAKFRGYWNTNSLNNDNSWREDPRADTQLMTTEVQGQTTVNRRVTQNITGSIKKKRQQKPCVQQVANLGLRQVNSDCHRRRDGYL